LAKLEGVNDRDQADALRGALVCVRRSQFPELEDGEFYAVDVIGLEVVVTDEDSRVLGTVRDYVQYPTTSVFVVDCAAGGTLEVPVLEQFIEQVGRERVLVKNIGLLVE
jgi:16S rRNA processing protein RimM